MVIIYKYLNKPSNLMMHLSIKSTYITQTMLNCGGGGGVIDKRGIDCLINICDQKVIRFLYLVIMYSKLIAVPIHCWRRTNTNCSGN